MMIALASCTTLILDQLEKAPTESTVISPVGSLKKTVDRRNARIQRRNACWCEDNALVPTSPAVLADDH